MSDQTEYPYYRDLFDIFKVYQVPKLIRIWMSRALITSSRRSENPLRQGPLLIEKARSKQTAMQPSGIDSKGVVIPCGQKLLRLFTWVRCRDFVYRNAANRPTGKRRPQTRSS